jgi:two-component system, cell cycle response regulator DivK
MKKVLVGDDNALNANLAKAILSRAGHEVDTVNSALAAFEYLETHTPDVVLSDISMPGMSGKDLCIAIRREKKHPMPKLIAYTAFAMQSERQAILDAGFDDIVVKPASRDELLRAVAQEP